MVQRLVFEERGGALIISRFVSGRCCFVKFGGEREGFVQFAVHLGPTFPEKNKWQILGNQLEAFGSSKLENQRGVSWVLLLRAQVISKRTLTVAGANPSS